MKTMKVNENLKMNDGGGILDNVGMIDSLIVDCNDAVKALTGGQYIQFCNTIVRMTQKLGSLKKGYQNEIENKDAEIQSLLKRLDAMVEQSIHEKAV